jgi:hypothetical protein
MIAPDWAGYQRFRPMIEEALAPDFYPIAYVDQLLLSGQAQVFLSDHAAMVAELKQYPGGARVVHCLVAAGRIDEIVDVLRPEVEAWGLRHGCGRALVESRAGWMRVLKPHGYDIFQISVMKEF